MYGLSGLSSSHVVRICSIRYYSSKSTKKLLEFLADMPKANSARIVEAQRQRQNIAKKSDKYAPSTVYLQVIGSGAKGAPNTLYLFTDQKRYLFNCGECTQRLAHEHKVKLSRLDHIFITSKTWRNIGGLPGLSLTLQDVGVPNITLHGPEGLDELYNATKRFVVMKDMNVTMAKCSPTNDFEDNALSVKYVILTPNDRFIPLDKPVPAKKQKLDDGAKEFEEFFHDETDYYKTSIKHTDSTSNRKEKLKPKPKEKEMDKAEKLLAKTERALHNLGRKSPCSVAYICTLKKRLGTLDLAKCVELGVKPGPLLGQLKSGQDVVLSNGTLVLSKDVKTPDDPGPVFIVIELPELSYLNPAEFAAHFDNKDNPRENIPTLIVHYTPPHVFNHPEYRSFMALFGPSTRHLVLNSQNSCLGSEAVHRTQHKLNLLDSDIFPLLKDASVPAVWNSSPPPSSDSPTRRGLEDLKNKIAVAQFQNIINMEGSKGDGQSSQEEGDKKLEIISPRTLTMFHLRPKREVDRSAEPKLHIQDYIQETMDVDGFVGSLEKFRLLIENIRYAKINSQREYPKVVFLGTGSCIPSKTRNTSAIVLQVSESKSMLLDCGEGTYGQLVRFYGPKKVNSFLRSLTAVYVSHLHADHHIGLIGVLQARREAFEQAEVLYEPLYLLAPGQIVTWLSVYDHQFEHIKPDYTLVPNQNLMMLPESSIVPANDISPAILASIGVQNIRTCLVQHCPNAFGVCIDIDGHNKLSYSGDTIPCTQLAMLGRDSTLLIHEATMEDELAEEARVKMHSTTSQAIDIGKQMNAQYTILTHFSQRYARLPRLNANMLNDNKNVGIAFDNMQISMNDLELLPHMYAPLQLMFAEHCVEMELKAKHREINKQRRAPSPTMPSSEVAGRSRWLSPGCRTGPSNTTDAIYRETNASRLRQEIRGMMNRADVRKGARSASASPTKKMFADPSPTRSLNGDSELMKKKSDKNFNIAASRTVSETSNSNIDPRVLTPGTCGIVDTRTKTLNSPVNARSTEKVVKVPKPQTEIHKEKKPVLSTKPASKRSVSPPLNKGYGKPLVTPVNMKLSIRRDTSPSDPRTPGTATPVPKETHKARPVAARIPTSRSPDRSQRSHIKPNQAIQRPPFNTSPKIPFDIIKSQLQTQPKVDIISSVLIHLIIWRVVHIASYLFAPAWPCAMFLIALGLVFWTAAKEISPGISTPINMPSVQTTASPRHRQPVKQEQRPASVAPSRVERSKDQHKLNEIKSQSTRGNTNRNTSKVVRLVTQEPRTANLATTHAAKGSPFKSSPLRSPVKIRSENQLEQRNLTTERLKQQFFRDKPVFTANRPNSIIHSSTFKPQLEDIKSSYLLLNKKEQEYGTSSEVKAESRDNKDRTELKRVINDNERRENLNKIKEKFTSKRFMNESKYDKIEGLNWISWK